MEEGEATPNLVSRGYRMLLALACVVIIIAGLKLSREVMVPLMVAFFLSVLSLPILKVLRKWGIPRFPAVLLTVVVDMAILSPIVFVGLNMTNEFQEKYNEYATALENQLASFQGWLKDEFNYEMTLDTEEVLQAVNSWTLNFLGGAAEFLRDFTFVFIIMIFFLAEAGGFTRKIGPIRRADGPDLARFQNTATDVQKYLGIKTLISALTGLFAGLAMWAMGLSFAMLWGLIAFVFNFIPAIGSIIASIPPALLALIAGGPGTAALVLLIYLSINMVFGNLIEPTLLGRRFGISTSVVVLSVLFWGWVWGLVGMFLAVPLTMLLKVALDHSPDFRWISLAISKDPTASPPADLALEEGAEDATEEAPGGEVAPQGGG